MTIKLSRTDQKQRDEFVSTLRERHATLAAALETFNAATQEAWGPVADALQEYNGTLADAKEFAREHAEEWREEHDGKSDKWQEGERGQQADRFIDTWGEFDPDEIEIEAPEDIEIEDDDTADKLEGLPTDPEGDE